MVLIDGGWINIADPDKQKTVQVYFAMNEIQEKMQTADADDDVIDFFYAKDPKTVYEKDLWPTYWAGTELKVSHGFKSGGFPGLCLSGAFAVGSAYEQWEADEIFPAFSLNKQQVKNLGLTDEEQAVLDFGRYFNDELDRGVDKSVLLQVCDQNDGGAFKNYRRAKHPSLKK